MSPFVVGVVTIIVALGFRAQRPSLKGTNGYADGVTRSWIYLLILGSGCLILGIVRLASG